MKLYYNFSSYNYNVRCYVTLGVGVASLGSVDLQSTDNASESDEVMPAHDTK